MTLFRITLAVLIIAFFPVQFTVGKEPVIDNTIVDIDDARVNPPDFEVKATETAEPTMLAACDKSLCEPTSR